MRSLIKTSTYAAMHFIVAFSVALALTGSITAAAAIGLVEPMVQTFAYAAHERAWEGRSGIREKQSHCGELFAAS
ncbi:MAG: DUF2061 domain-containing protein [Pseudomonadota bacterium]